MKSEQKYHDILTEATGYWNVNIVPILTEIENLAGGETRSKAGTYSIRRGFDGGFCVSESMHSSNENEEQYKQLKPLMNHHQYLVNILAEARHEFWIELEKYLNTCEFDYDIRLVQITVNNRNYWVEREQYGDPVYDATKWKSLVEEKEFKSIKV